MVLLLVISEKFQITGEDINSVDHSVGSNRYKISNSIKNAGVLGISSSTIATSDMASGSLDISSNGDQSRISSIACCDENIMALDGGHDGNNSLQANLTYGATKESIIRWISRYWRNQYVESR